MCYRSECGPCRSDGTRIIIHRSAGKMTPRATPFKITRGYRNWHGSIGYLWLPVRVIHSNNALIWYRLRDKRRLCRVFNAPLRGGGCPSATFKPKIVGGRSPFSFPPSPFPYPFATVSVVTLCCLSVLDRISHRWCDSRHLYLFVELWLWTIPSTGHRITKNNRLTHLGEMPGVGGQFARVGGFSLTSLHVKSCSAWGAHWNFVTAVGLKNRMMH